MKKRLMEPPPVVATWPELLTDAQAAARLGTTRATLANWRCTGRVPLPYCKLGRSIRYRVADLDAFIAAHMIGVPETQ